jgi:hypothetical protein
MAWTRSAEYVASYPDLIAAYGTNVAMGEFHWNTFGQAEGRTVRFNGMGYIAASPDLIAAFGANAEAGAVHYIRFGRNEARDTDFDADQYLANYADLRAAFGADQAAATQHYVVHGHAEGRTDGAMVARTPNPGSVITGGPEHSNDVLVGTPGDDTIIGGFGGDTMTGGDGEDIFRFGTELHPGTAFINVDTNGGPGAIDTITDFQQGQDKIDISRLGTNYLGDQFTGIWIGTAPFSSVGPHPRNADGSSGAPRDVPPEIRYEFRKAADGSDVTVIQMDGPVAFESLKHGSTPLDARADAEIVLAGRIELTAGDIIL